MTLLLEIFLDERRAEVDVQLHEWSITDASKTMYLTRLDHQYVAGAGLEFFTVHGPAPAPFADELHLVVRMAMRPRAASRKAMKKKYGDANISVVSTDEIV
ncbi:MAG TPA: hypothetical protein VIQ74_12425 [Gemmatimonadaceae bacterium]